VRDLDCEKKEGLMQKSDLEVGDIVALKDPTHKRNYFQAKVTHIGAGEFGIWLLVNRRIGTIESAINLNTTSPEVVKTNGNMIYSMWEDCVKVKRTQDTKKANAIKYLSELNDKVLNVESFLISQGLTPSSTLGNISMSVEDFEKLIDQIKSKGNK